MRRPQEEFASRLQALRPGQEFLKHSITPFESWKFSKTDDFQQAKAALELLQTHDKAVDTDTSFADFFRGSALRGIAAWADRRRASKQSALPAGPEGHKLAQANAAIETITASEIAEPLQHLVNQYTAHLIKQYITFIAHSVATSEDITEATLKKIQPTAGEDSVVFSGLEGIDAYSHQLVTTVQAVISSLCNSQSCKSAEGAVEILQKSDCEYYELISDNIASLISHLQGIIKHHSDRAEQTIITALQRADRETKLARTVETLETNTHRLAIIKKLPLYLEITDILDIFFDRERLRKEFHLLADRINALSNSQAKKHLLLLRERYISGYFHALQQAIDNASLLESLINEFDNPVYATHKAVLSDNQHFQSIDKILRFFKTPTELAQHFAECLQELDKLPPALEKKLRLLINSQYRRKYLALLETLIEQAVEKISRARFEQKETFLFELDKLYKTVVKAEDQGFLLITDSHQYKFTANILEKLYTASLPRSKDCSRSQDPPLAINLQKLINQANDFYDNWLEKYINKILRYKSTLKLIQKEDIPELAQQLSKPLLAAYIDRPPKKNCKTAKTIILELSKEPRNLEKCRAELEKLKSQHYWEHSALYHIVLGIIHFFDPPQPRPINPVFARLLSSSPTAASRSSKSIDLPKAQSTLNVLYQDLIHAQENCQQQISLLGCHVSFFGFTAKGISQLIDIMQDYAETRVNSLTASECSNLIDQLLEVLTNRPAYYSCYDPRTRSQTTHDFYDKWVGELQAARRMLPEASQLTSPL